VQMGGDVSATSTGCKARAVYECTGCAPVRSAQAGAPRVTHFTTMRLIADYKATAKAAAR